MGYLRVIFIYSILLISVMCTLSSNIAYAGQSMNIEKIYSKFILNYVGYVTWPPEILKKGGDLNACFMSGDVTATYFSEMAQDNGLYDIKTAIKEEHAPIDDCHILFISQMYKSEMKYLIEISAGKNILTLSDIEGFVEAGGISGFTVGDDVKLKLNLTAIKKTKMQVDSDFLGIMEIIE